MLFLESQIRAALLQCREQTFQMLANAELCQTSLFTDIIWASEYNLPQRRAVLLRALLLWAAEQQRPFASDPDPTDPRWRNYLLLTRAYLAKPPQEIDTVRRTMRMRTKTWKACEQASITQLVRTWETAINAEPDSPLRLDCYAFVLRQRQLALPKSIRPILYALSLLDQPLSMAQFGAFYKESVGRDVEQMATSAETVFNTLNAHHLLTFHHLQGTLALQPTMQTYLRQQLATQHKDTVYHFRIAKFYENQQDILHSLYHFTAANTWETVIFSAEQQYDQLVANGQANPLRQRLEIIKDAVQTPKLRGRLYYLLGRLASHDAHLSTAQRYYEIARDTNSPIWINACYELARVLQRRNLLDEAIYWYKTITEKLNRPQTASNLPGAAYLGLALIYIQERPNSGKAKHYLQQAKQFISPNNRAMQAEWHNLRGTMLGHQGQMTDAIPYYLQAYLHAVEGNNQQLLMRTARNLGTAYTFTQRLKEGLQYLTKALVQAKEQTDEQMQGECYKGIGANHFFDGAYSEAIIAYRQASELFERLDNQNWLASVSFDLLEVYATIGDVEATALFLQRTKKLTGDAQIERLQGEIDKLMRFKPLVFSKELGLSARQIKGLEYLKIDSQLTKEIYKQQNKIHKKTAQRDLSELVKKGILMKVGKGRALYYTWATS
ncbi:MAG: tetratricopeptide repeat protein [Candidatus Promineifilaceae bacterium]